MAKNKKDASYYENELQDAVQKYHYYESEQTPGTPNLAAMEMQKDRYEKAKQNLQSLAKNGGYIPKGKLKDIFSKENIEEAAAMVFNPIKETLTQGNELTAEENKTPAKTKEEKKAEQTEINKKAKAQYDATFGEGYTGEPLNFNDQGEVILDEEPVTEEITEDVTTTPEAETVTTTEETIPEVTTNAETTPAKKSFDWRNSIEDMARYGGALYDSLTAMHKRKANQAAALSGFAGQYGSTTPIFAEEETEAPLEKLRKQAYENYTSQMRAAQEAENKALQTDIKNKYKSIYDIDAQNTAERQAYINEKLGTVQNDLNINLNKKLREMNKAELTDYLKRLQDNLDKISDRIKDEGFINGLKNSLPDLIRLSQEGQLTGQMIGTNADVVGNSITGALDAGSTIGTLLSKVF